MANMIARKRGNRRRRESQNNLFEGETVSVENMDNWVEILTCTGRRMLIKATASVGGGPLRVVPFDPENPPAWL